MISYADACRIINEHRGESAAVTTMTQSSYWNKVSEHPDLDMGISNGMSKASSVALGIALGDPERKVLCLDGDGSLLMNFGSLATVAGMAPKNFHHFVFNNGIYAITGGQPLPETGVQYADAAKACGYKATFKFDDLESFENSMAEIMATDGPILIELVVTPEPATEGVDQTWESNAKMPRQLRAMRKRLTGKDDWGPGGPFI